MSVIVDLVEDVFDGISDAVSWVIDEVIDPVVNVVGNVVQGMLDNPIKAIAQIAAITVSGGAYAWTLPLIEGADVAIKGGDVGDVLEATAKAYVAQQIGTAAGKYAYQGASTAAAGAAYGTSGQQAAMLAAQEVGMRTAADLAGQIVGSAAASAGAGIVYGRDPIEALKMGLVSAGTSQLVSLTLGELDRQTGGTFAKLRSDSPTAAAVIESAVTAQVTGQNVTEAAIAAAIKTSKVAIQFVDQFTKDNPNISDSQKAIAAQILTNVTATAFAGGDPSRALQATLMQVGSKALGEVVEKEFKEITQKVKNAYDKAQISAADIDNNIAQQQAVANDYNQVGAELNAKIAEQNRLRELADSARLAYEANPNQQTADAANAAIKTFNDYVGQLNKDYAETYKPELDKYSKTLSELQTKYGQLEKDHIKDIEGIQIASGPLQQKYNQLYFNTSRAFVETMDPNFNVDEYRQINNLDTSVDVYEHWLTEGQFKGLKTNQKDVNVSEALSKYEEAFGEPPPEHMLGKLMDSTNPNRDKATELFVDTKIKDRQQQENYKAEVRSRIIDSYRSEGFSDAQINQKIASGEVDSLTDQIVQDVRTDLGDRKEYVNQVAEKYGTDSAEYKAAYRDTLSGMAETGGFGVVKDGNDFIADAGARINGDTLESNLVHLGGGKGWLDPVTGQIHTPLRIDIIGTADSPNYSALFGLGASAKPPEQGGISVFGDGSGVSSGRFGGLTPIATDTGTGATLYGGDNGFAFIAYSDGRGAAIDAKTNEVIWVTPDKTKEILEKTPVAEPAKPVEAKPDAPEPIKPPPITKPVDTAVEQIKAKIQSPEDVKKAMESLGYKPTDEEVRQFTGEIPADKLLKNLTTYIDPRLVTDEEAKKAYEALGVKNPTQEDIDKIKGQYAQTELESRAQANLDAARYNSLYKQLEQLQGGAPLSEETQAKLGQLTQGQQTLAGQLAQQGLDLNAAIDAAKNGIAADTQAKFNELDAGQKALAGQLTKQGVDLNTAIEAVQAGVTEQIEGVSADVQAKYDALTAEQKALANQLTQQGVNLSDAIAQAQTQTTQQITDVETRLTDAIAAAEAAGLTRDQAITAAVESVASDLGTTKTALLAQLGTTEAALRQELSTGLAGVSADVQAKYDALTAEQKALANQLTQQGVDLNTAIDTAKSEITADVQAKYDALTAEQKALANQLTQQGVDLNTAINTATSQLQGQINLTQQQIQQVADFVGKPYRDVTQADIDFVSSIVDLQQTQPGTALTPQQLAYDANRDGRIDQADVDLLQGVVRGTVEQPFVPGAGSIWTQQPTGIYGILAGQAADAAARDAAARDEAQRIGAAQLGQQRQMAQQVQQRQNVNMLQQMLMGAPDIAGQQVTVKAPDPARIGYVYDIAGPSIFATPQQEKMFITPYVEGGMVDDTEAVNEELLRILRS
jgi:hypothetical protein